MKPKTGWATQILLFGALGLSLVACTLTLSGRVNTISLASPPKQPLFIVISQDSVSYRERMIVGLLEMKMSERGFVKTSASESANVTVQYKYSIGPGRTEVSSSQDYVYGGMNVSSSTEYPRTFEIIVIDDERSKASGKVEIIWQGEIYSSGSSSDMTLLAPNFIDVLYENYGTTTTNKRFFRKLD